MNRKTYEEIQIFNQGMRDMGQGLGALGQAAEGYRFQNMMHKAGADMLEVIRTKGVQGLDAQTLAGIAQKHNMGADGISMTLALMKQSGAALKANQEYLTEVENTRTTRNQGNLYDAQTGKAVAETQTENELRPWKARSEEKLGDQRESAVRLNDANTNQVNALTPVKVREGESRIAVNGSAANLNNTRAGDIIAKQPGEIAATKALAEQRRAAAAQNGAGGKANNAQLLKAGIAAGIAASNVGPRDADKDGNLIWYSNDQLVRTKRAYEQLGLVPVFKVDPKTGKGYLASVQLAGGPQSARPAAPQAKPKPAASGGKPIDKATVTKLLVQTGGDVAKARLLARQQGYTF